MLQDILSVFKISLGSYAHAANSTARHDPFHDHEHHCISTSIGRVSDDISLPQSGMRMCLTMMLNSLLFPRLCFRLFLHKLHHSLEPFPNAHTRPRPTNIGD